MIVGIERGRSPGEGVMEKQSLELAPTVAVRSGTPT
jgi:hypothetical protein